MADTKRTYTINARQMWILRVTIDPEFAARACDPEEIDATLDEIGVTNNHERLHLKAIAKRHMQQQAVLVQHEDYREGRETWDAGDHDDGIPDSDPVGAGTEPWQP